MKILVIDKNIANDPACLQHFRRVTSFEFEFKYWGRQQCAGVTQGHSPKDTYRSYIIVIDLM